MIDIVACIFSGIALGISIFAFFSHKKILKTSRESKFIDETISVNDITIQYPILRKVYMNQDNPNSKPTDESEVEMLTSFCYKHLNILDSMNVHCSAAKKHMKTSEWIDNEISNETYFGNWCNFYSRTFRKGIIGYGIMSNILDDNNNSGDYSSAFVSFIKYLINKY